VTAFPAAGPDGDGGLLLKHFSKRLGKDMLHYAPALFIPAFLNLAGIFIFTRVFSTTAYGRYVLVFATATVLSILLAEWLVHSGLRFIPKFESSEDRGRIFKNLISLLAVEVGGLAALTILAYAFGGRILGSSRGLFFLGAWILAAMMAFKLGVSMFQARLQAAQYARYQILFGVGRLGLSLALIYLVSRRIEWLLVGIAMSYTLLLVPMAAELRLGRFWRGLSVADFSMAKRLTAYGLPVVAWALGTEILMVMDKYLIALIRNADEVGIYGANYSLAFSGIGMIAIPIIMAAHPLLITAWERHDDIRIRELISDFSRYYLALVLPLFAVVVLFRREVAAIMLGPSFREGSVVIPVVFAGYLAWNFGMYGHKGLELLERTGLMFALVAICAGLNVVLNLVLLPAYGYKGSAVASSVSLSFYPLLVFLVSKRRLNFPWQIPWRSLFRLAGSAGLMFLAMNGLKRILGGMNAVFQMAVVGTAGLLLYGLLALVSGEIREEEKRVVRRFLRKRRAP